MSFGSLQRRILGPIIPIIRIQGIITEPSVSKLEKSLANFRPERAQAMAVLVNSPGGLIVPTFTVCDILKEFSKKTQFTNLHIRRMYRCFRWLWCSFYWEQSLC